MGCKDIGIRKLEFGAKTQFPLQEQEKVETDFNENKLKWVVF